MVGISIRGLFVRYLSLNWARKLKIWPEVCFLNWLRLPKKFCEKIIFWKFISKNFWGKFFENFFFEFFSKNLIRGTTKNSWQSLQRDSKKFSEKKFPKKNFSKKKFQNKKMFSIKNFPQQNFFTTKNFFQKILQK